MKTPILVALLSLSASAETWTLDRAIATALEKNPDALAARARVEAAEALVQQAGAAWMPQVLLSGRYTQTNSPMMAFGSILNQRAFNFGLDFNHPGRIDDLNATGTVAYNLYGGGRPTAGRSAARSGVEAASHDLRAAQDLLSAEVVKAALQVKKAREAIVAVEGGAKAYEAAVSVARARFEAGQMLKADLLSLEVQLAQTREALSTARNGAALAERAFLYTLGLDASPGADSVEFVDQDPVLTRLTVPASLEFSNRPELKGLEARLKAAEAMVSVARGGRRPTVNAFASYQVDQGWQTDSHGDSWLAGVSVDVSVFDGGQTSGKIRQAAAELTQVKEMLRKVKLGIGLEVEQARLSHENALERLEVTTRALELAEESARLTRARFEKETLLTADLIGVEGRLLEARLRHTIAAADERLALVELRRTVGLKPIE